MAAQGQSKAEKFSRWELLLTNTQPEEGQPPHVTADLTDLESKLREVRTLESRQEDLRSQARELGTRIRVMAREGDRVRARIGANLKSKYGFESETLMKYGFKPRLAARRRPKEKLPVEAPDKA